jgi:hypothetical protein
LDEAEQEAVVLPPDAQAGMPASGRPLLPQGSALAMIDLIVDDSLPIRGSRRRTSRWSRPRIGAEPQRRQMVTQWRRRAGGLILRSWHLCERRRSSRARVGRPSSSGMQLTPTRSPSSPLTTRMKCNTGSTSRGSARTPCGLYGWSWIPSVAHVGGLRGE